MPIEKPQKQESYTLLSYEAKIYDAQQTMIIGRCSVSEISDALISSIQYSGCQQPSKEVFAFCLKFIVDNFRIFRLKELITAFELYALGKLNVDKSIIFNAKLIGDVMNAYKPLSLQVREKTEPKIEEVKCNIEVDEEQAIKDEAEWWNTTKNKDWRMLNHLVFDYLWKRKIIKIDKEKADAIKRKVTAHYSTRVQTDKDKEMLQDDSFIKLACKRYSLSLYLNGELC